MREAAHHRGHYGHLCSMMFTRNTDRYLALWLPVASWANVIVGCGPFLTERDGQERARFIAVRLAVRPPGERYRGRRCRITTSSVPEPGPLFVPDGWPLSYGFDWLGQPV